MMAMFKDSVVFYDHSKFQLCVLLVFGCKSATIIKRSISHGTAKPKLHERTSKAHNQRALEHLTTYAYSAKGRL